MLWRACRGNVFLRQAEIETPLEDPSTVRINHIVKKINYIHSKIIFKNLYNFINYLKTIKNIKLHKN